MAQDATALQLLVVFAGAALGVSLLSYALQGYLLGIGPLAPTLASAVVRVLLVLAGILLAAPEWRSDLAGLGIAVVTYTVLLLSDRARGALLAVSPVPDPVRPNPSETG